ncbi:DUF2628 domain-containing protein [Halobacillus sp. Cin3]|uniref:DUF2628 domain-containing protein n=1 Tax=Halobacillus sp. Cin3 TaxID=2928441 RepID=UPI00248D5360|nr:DUF2628 domain-containing protein [Halobacillus sp. Cin3]
MEVSLQNNAGVVKEVKVGFSWTTFFFGFIPALIRGDLKWSAIMFITALLAGIFTLGFGAWIPGIIFSFVYNKIYIKGLLEKGYLPKNQRDREILEQQDIIAPSVQQA